MKIDKTLRGLIIALTIMQLLVDLKPCAILLGVCLISMMPLKKLSRDLVLVGLFFTLMKTLKANHLSCANMLNCVDPNGNSVCTVLDPDNACITYVSIPAYYDCLSACYIAGAGASCHPTTCNSCTSTFAALPANWPDIVIDVDYTGSPTSEVKSFPSLFSLSVALPTLFLPKCAELQIGTSGLSTLDKIEKITSV